MLINNEEGNRTVKAWSYATNILIYFSYMVLLTFIFLSYYDKDASVNREHVVNYEYKKHIPKDYRKIIIYSCLIGNMIKLLHSKDKKVMITFCSLIKKLKIQIGLYIQFQKKF